MANLSDENNSQQQFNCPAPSATYSSGTLSQKRFIDRDCKSELFSVSQTSPLPDQYENIEMLPPIKDQMAHSDTMSTFKNKNVNNSSNPEENIEDLQEKLFKCNSARIKWRIGAMCAWFFAIGWNDATAGSILAYIEDYYNISYALVSLIWLGNALGYITIALTSHWLNNKFGFYRMVIFSPIFYCIMAAIISSGTKFPLIVVAYYSAGLGASIGLSQFNVYLSRFDISSTLLGAGHGFYGLGATMAPIISTVMTDHDVSWHFFYLCLLGFMVFNAINLYFSFQGIDDDLIELSDEHTKEVLHITASLKNTNTWLVCFFILFYQGAEVGLAGYIVSYLLDYRNGDISTAGYVASGFWGGLTVGRFLMTTYMLKTIGARRSITILTILSIIFIILSWFIPNLILESVLVSIAGIFIGPMYSMIISAASRIIPRKLVIVSLSLASAFGSTGGSLFPFLIGLISQFRGSYVVLPFSIALFVAMLACWVAMPNFDRPNIKNWWERLV